MINIKKVTVITGVVMMLITSACGNESTKTSDGNVNQKSETIQGNTTTDSNQEQEDKKESINKEESGDIEENQGNNAESGSSDTSDDKKIGGNSKETNDKNVSETKTIQSNQSDQSNQDTQDKEILIIIDQTEKPTTGNSFDFFVNKAPEGYNLVEMQWLSEHSVVKNTIQEAVEHGSNGEDGFYISGNGQYSGFIYPDNLKGEKGKVLFLFRDEHGNELTWEKEITL